MEDALDVARREEHEVECNRPMPRHADEDNPHACEEGVDARALRRYRVTLTLAQHRIYLGATARALLIYEAGGEKGGGRGRTYSLTPASAASNAAVSIQSVLGSSILDLFAARLAYSRKRR